MKYKIQPPAHHIFLGWNQPPIESLSSWLIERFADTRQLNLSGMILVLPAAVGIHNLLHSLINFCQEQGLSLIPPQCVTLGSFPEMLYTPRAAAPKFLQSLLWADTAKQFMQNGHLGPVFPSPPPIDDFVAWQTMGEQLSSIHAELAGELVDFQSVIDYCDQFEYHQESKRWKTLRRLQRSYLDAVDELNLWDLQTARVTAVEKNECDTQCEVVVAGCVDINNTVKAMLSSIHSKLTVVTFAPSDQCSRFDDLGALIPERWDDVPAQLTDNHLIFVESSEDQAIACAEQIVNIASTGVPLNDVAIALPDVADLPSLDRLFHRHQTPLCYKQGRPITSTPACVLLFSVRDYLETASYHSFATLLRHPKLHDILKSRDDDIDLLTLSDQFHEEFLPLHVDRLDHCPHHFVPLREAKDQLTRLLARFHPNTASLRSWCDELLAFLTLVYGDTLVNRSDPEDRALLGGVHAISQIVNDLIDSNDLFEAQCTAAEYIRLVLSQLADNHTEIDQGSHGVPVVGWLDISWLSHTHVLVTSFNEGLIPSSITSDLFLPNSVRESLGLVDNQRRFARDAYTTSLLLKGRENVSFISKKYASSGDPLWPSRLCLSGDYPSIARRLQKFSQGSLHQPEYQINYDVRSSPAEGLNIVQAPHKRTTFAVTEFRDYLACPLRYYLTKVLRLRPMDDDSTELSPLSFGNLLHEVLLVFGQSPLKDSVDVPEIQQFLRASLGTIAQRDFGELSYPVISVQLKQLEHRLDAFAIWQASRTAEGWTIYQCEFDCPTGVPISTDHPELLVHGRIDRIDHHPNTGDWAIFDYKSSETAQTPKQAHNTSVTPFWVDLQLPLYRHLAKELTGESKIQLGYINICNDTSNIRAEIADWTPSELETADDVALQVMLGIQRGEFPMAPDPPKFVSEYAYLLGDISLDGMPPVITMGKS
ncbi:MAG: PD-(D/E)XK nuclease family protein [Planctomycetota bacterium]|nr:PD-(D/E)XK nuclease family protein [Planctomycetota bacterium]